MNVSDSVKKGYPGADDINGSPKPDECCGSEKTSEDKNDCSGFKKKACSDVKQEGYCCLVTKEKNCSDVKRDKCGSKETECSAAWNFHRRGSAERGAENRRPVSLDVNASVSALGNWVYVSR